MDFFPFITRVAYNNICATIRTASCAVAEGSMARAAVEELDETQEAVDLPLTNLIAVSVDGSWMKRGFSSLHGLIAVIGRETGKVIDVSVKSLYCSFCRQWKNEEGTLEFEDVMRGHEPDYDVNHIGKSGAMEAAAAVELFGRSQDKRDLIYKVFIGDGDSRSYKAVVSGHPYGEENPVIKKECIGHVGKRMEQDFEAS